jgi:hypothetical protein
MRDPAHDIWENDLACGHIAVFDRVRQRTEWFRRAAGYLDHVANVYEKAQRSNFMLETIAVVLIVLWLAGLVTSYTLGGFIHILLVLAIIMILVRVIGGRRAV